MITREQVADLREGDVVELRHPDAAWTITGPLVPLFNGLGVAGWAVTEAHPDSINAQLDVRIVSRAPRPLYVNHPRTKPVPGDVVRLENGDGPVVMFTRSHGWVDNQGDEWDPKRKDGLRLLVDGETGLPVGTDPANAWGEGFEAGAEHCASSGLVGIPHDPPRNPYETGQVGRD